MARNRSCPAVSHNCSRTVVPLSTSKTFLTRNDAPTVEAVAGGLKVPLTYRWSREVLPTPIDSQFHNVKPRNIDFDLTLSAQDTYLGLQAARHDLIHKKVIFGFQLYFLPKQNVWGKSTGWTIEREMPENDSDDG